MLSPLQVEILEIASRSNGYVYIGVSPDDAAGRRYSELCGLQSLGLVAVDMALHARITPAGREALAAFHESRKQESKKRAERESDAADRRNKQLLAGVKSFFAEVIGQFLARFFR